MRKRILLIAVPLVIVAIAASVAVRVPRPICRALTWSSTRQTPCGAADRRYRQLPPPPLRDRCGFTRRPVTKLGTTTLQDLTTRDYLHSLAVQVRPRVHPTSLAGSRGGPGGPRRSFPKPVSSAVYSNNLPG